MALSFLFITGGPVYPLLKEIRKEALKHLFLVFRKFQQLLTRLPLPGHFTELGTFQSKMDSSTAPLDLYESLGKLGMWRAGAWLVSEAEQNQAKIIFCVGLSDYFRFT